MALQRYHLLKKNDEWQLRKAGLNHRAVVKADTKSVAILKMQGYMKTHEGSVRIHKSNGRIQEERTYQSGLNDRLTPESGRWNGKGLRGR